MIFTKDINPLGINLPCNGAYVVNEVPDDPSKTVKVRIRAVDQEGVFDWSDNVFEIAQPAITVTKPNGGEKYDPGTVGTVNWTSYALAGNVNIEYSKDDFVADIHPIAMNQANTGSYAWMVPYDPSTTVKVRISSVKYPSVFDKSDNNFTIVQPVIHVTSPNGGEEWKSFSSQNITWTSQDLIGNVNIQYSKDNFVSDVETIAANVPNNGSYIWSNIPCNISNTLRFAVQSCTFVLVMDASDLNFSIVSAIRAMSIGLANRDEGWDIKVDGSGKY